MSEAKPYSRLDEALERARAGDGFCVFAHDQDTLSAGVVMDGAGEFINIGAGEAAVITGLYFHVSSVSDTMEIEIGYTASVDAAGAFTALTPPFHIETGATLQPNGFGILHFNPPLYVKDTTGASVAVKITANDDGAVCTFGLHGWLEAY